MNPVSYWLRFVLILLATVSASKATAQSGNSDLQLSFTNSSAFAASTGQHFKCTINLYNGGSETATNSTITNWLPAGLEFVSATSSRGYCSQSAGMVTCALGNLPPYQSATLTMEFKGVTVGSYTNIALAVSATPDPNSTNNQASFITLITQARFFGVGPTHIPFYDNPRLTLMTNNQVLVVGQHNGTTTELYNMSSRTFTFPIGTAVGVHKHGSVTVLTNGLVLLAGGANATAAKTAELYNPATQLFRQVGDMLVYSYGHNATLKPDGTVVLCGGGLTTNQLFNPITETFTFAPSQQCAFNGIYLPTGKFLYFGYGRAYLYDTNTSTSVETSGFLQPRAYHSAALLQNGKVLIAGGHGTWGTTTGPLSSAEIYDPATDTFTWTANLTTPRLHHSACQLPDGTILLAGGMVSENDPFSLTNAEVYDPTGAVNVPGVGVNDASLVEGDSGTNWMQFTVWLTRTSSLPVTVRFTTAAGTAGVVDWGVANLDFANTNGTLTFSPGQTSAIVNVPIFGDLIREPDETVSLTLSLPTQAWTARAQATGMIIDNDPMPTISVSPASLAERDLARSNLTFQVSLSLPTTSTVFVDYSTADQDAIAGSDYLPATGTLAFAAGTTTLAVEVPIMGDLSSESDETFLLNLSNAQNAIIGIGSASGTILNDDALPGKLHHFDWSFIGDPQVQGAGFPVTITARDYFGNVATNVPWPVRLSGQTTNYAATNLDFEGPTLAPWTTFNYTPYEKSFSQRLMDVTGMGPLSMAFRTGAGGGTNGIEQDIFLIGGIPYVFSANILAGREDIGDSTCWGETIYLQVGTNTTSVPLPNICSGYAGTRITMSYTPPTTGIYPLRFTIYRPYYWVRDSYFVYLDDVQISYPVITPVVATNFVNGVWTGTVTLLQYGTNISLLANDNGGHTGNSNPFNVLPSTDPGVTLATNWSSTLRTGDRLTFNLAVTNRGANASIDTVLRWAVPTNLTFLSSSNLQGTITNQDGILQWTIGSLAVGSNVNASLVMRADIPGLLTNTFNLTNSVTDVNLSNNVQAVLAQVYPPLLVISNASGTEGFAATTGMLFQLTLSGPSGETISGDYFTVNGSATNGQDFIGTNGTVVIPPGATNAAITVYALEDILDEPNRTFAVQLTNIVNAIASIVTATGTISDDDLPPAISIADASAFESDSGITNLVFQLILSKPAIYDVSVRCTTATNTAATNDYTHTVTTVVFPAGSTNATFAVPILGNLMNEPDETFFVNLTLPTNASIADTQAVGTILNDDAVPGRLDHFAWDTLPSPRYNGSPFPVVLRALDYLGNPATNSIGSVSVTARIEDGMLDRLRDDFEDGDSVGWTNFNNSFLTPVVTNETAVQGLKSLRLTGSNAYPFSGLRRGVSNSQPNKIAFAARVGRTNQRAGEFSAMAGSTWRSVQFYFNNNGQMGLQDRQLGFRGVPYESNRWYQIELTLNWPAQKIDCRIDGVLAITNITFADTNATSMDFVYLGNYDNTTSWWDNIQVFNDNVTNFFTISPSIFTAFANGVKSTSVTISGVSSNVFLTADDGLEHVGKSGLFDLLSVSLSLQMPASVHEGYNPNISAQVRLSAPIPQLITVNLTSSVPAKLTVPASVTFGPNQTNMPFNLTVVNDTNLDWVKPVSVIASRTNLVSATNVISVIDNDPQAGLVQIDLTVDGRFQLGLQGPPARNYELIASTNLIEWDSILALSFTNAPVMFIDPASTNHDRRFYKLLQATQ